MAPLELAVRPANIYQFEEAAISALPVGDCALRFSIAAPEEVPCIGLRTGRKSFECLDHIGGKRHINGSSCFRLVEQKALSLQTMSLKKNCVADAQPAPAHEKRERAEPRPRVLDRYVSAARIAVDVRRIENPLEFIGRKIVGRNVNDLDPSEPESRILDEEAAAHTGPEEADHAALLLLLGEGAVLPGVAEVEKHVEVDLVDVLESLRLCPGKELFFEDGREFVERGLGHVATYRIGEVRLDGLLDGDSWSLGCGRQHLASQTLLDDWRWQREGRRRRGRLSGLRRWKRWLCHFLLEAKTEFLGVVPVMGAGAAADEVAVDGSPDPLRAVAAAPGLVAGILAVRMMAGVDGKHVDPDSSEILLRSLNSGKSNGATVQRLYSFPMMFPSDCLTC